ncbi:glycoside hydrolase family 18 protein [Actinacidiphila rubida]|nr:glycoside hydrolase family 18 protein [Actinacidiphila rubida]
MSHRLATRVRQRFRQWTPPSRRRVLRLLRHATIAATVLAVLAVAAAATALRAQYAGNPAAAGRTRGHDAVWLGHAWVDGRRGPADLALLRSRVRDSGISDLYVHTGPLADDGTLDPKLYPAAAAFIADVHRELPGVRVQAWLGDVVAHSGGPGLHLDDAALRSRVRDSCAQVLDAGFDGVHLDLEPVPSGDPGFLTLLDAVHQLTEERGVPLSAAVPQIDPLPHLHTVAHLPFSHPKWWAQAYFGQVARRVDQIAVMAYDTAMPTTSLFGGYVAQQTGLALSATPPSTELVIGLPGYHTGDMGHHAYAETVDAAVRGARVALARHDRHRRMFGLSLYVDFHATAGDWAAYRRGWGTEGGTP